MIISSLPSLYFASLLTGFALEFPAAYALWRLPVFADPSGPWGIALEWTVLIALAALVGLPEALLAPRDRKRAITRGTNSLRDVFLLVAAKSITIFGAFLCCDGLVLRVETLSFTELTICHFFWLPAFALFFCLWGLTPAGSRLLRQPKSASLPQHELALPVRVRGGRTIVLKPESLQEALFASEDSVLRHILRKAPSLAVLRRAIWLGSARNYQPDLLGELPVLTLSGLTSLIYEAARAGNLADAAAVPIPGEVGGVEHELVFVKE